MAHALFEACARLQARGGQLVIQLQTDSVVTRPLEIMGLTTAADIRYDRQEAIATAAAHASS